MKEEFNFGMRSEESMVRWYEWIINRKVLMVKIFPMPLSVFANLTTELDYGSYCPYIRSIEIINDMLKKAYPANSSEFSVLEERLYLFLRECVCLIELSIDCGVNSDVRDLVLSVLTKGLEVNTLQSVHIKVCTSISTSTVNMIRQLLANHLSSIHDLELLFSNFSEESMDEIMTILHEKPTLLKKLYLCIDHNISLLQVSRYLSSSGATMHLEVLSIEESFIVSKEDFAIGEILLHLGSACPLLRTLTVKACGVGSYQTFDQFPVTKLLQLYESCPNLISVKCLFNVTFPLFIEVDEDKRELRYNTGPICRYSIEKKAVFLECLRLAIQRSPYRLAVSNCPFCGNLITQYDEWVLFKSKLSPYLTDLVGKMTESILIEAVKGLPRLEKLSVYLEKEKFGDLSLAAIMEHGCGLKKLWINTYGEYELKQCGFSDEMINKVIRCCKMLEVLKILGAGQGSVIAVKHHSRLREVYLDEVRVGKEDLSTLLCVDERESEEKYVWRSLIKGEITGRDYVLKYNKKRECWE